MQTISIYRYAAHPYRIEREKLIIYGKLMFSFTNCILQTLELMVCSKYQVYREMEMDFG